MSKSAAFRLGEKAAEESIDRDAMAAFMRQTGGQYGQDARSPFIPTDPNKVEARTEAAALPIEEKYRNMYADVPATPSNQVSDITSSTNPALLAALQYARSNKPTGVQVRPDIGTQVVMKPTAPTQTAVASKPAPKQPTRNTGIRYRGPGMTAMKDWKNPNDLKTPGTMRATG